MRQKQILLMQYATDSVRKFSTNKIDKIKKNKNKIPSHRLVQLLPGAHKSLAMLQINSKNTDGCQSPHNFQWSQRAQATVANAVFTALHTHTLIPTVYTH